jgi:5,10-methylenetetrahydromethanopterin reductase
MGLGAVKLRVLEEYVRAVMALLREETIEAELEGQSRLIRLLNPELGLINTKDPIGLYVAAAGPRARELTARLSAGWINATPDVTGAVAALDEMRAAWSDAGHQPGALEAIALTGGVVLEEGEPADSPRAIAQAGPRAAMLLHRAADAALLGLPPIATFPPAVADAIAGYVALARQFRPQGAPYLDNHRGHLMFVKPEERPFVTAELIRATGFAAPERELKGRFAQLADAGYTEVAIQIVPGQEHAIEDWGRIRRAFA